MSFSRRSPNPRFYHLRGRYRPFLDVWNQLRKLLRLSYGLYLASGKKLLYSRKAMAVVNVTFTFHNGTIPRCWSASAILTLWLIVCGCLSNSIVLLSLFDSRLRKSTFNIYVANLLLTNILHLTLQKPFDLVKDLHSRQWILGWNWCNFYTYTSCMSNSLIYHAHGLITVNRIWAVMWPVSYKVHHTKTTAVLLWWSIWIYLHILILPEVIADGLYYRFLVNPDFCYLNQANQLGLVQFTQIWCYMLPLVFVPCAYPVILYKYCKWMKRRSVAPMLMNNATGSAVVNTKGHDADSGTIPIGKRRKKYHSSSFITLTMLTISVTICWFPRTMFYTVRAFFDIRNDYFLEVASVIYSLQAVMDPVYFVMALRDVRRAVLRLFSKPCTSVRWSEDMKI